MTIVASNSLTLSNVNDGTITHYAYAYSADGTDGFTTVYPNLNLLKNTKSQSYTSTGTANNNSSNNYPLDGIIADILNKPLTITYSYAITNSSGTWSGMIRPTYGLGGTNQSVSNTNLSGTHKETVTLTNVGQSSYGILTSGLPAGTKVTITNLKVEFGSTTTPHMPSASEVTTADWPSYIGQYSDFTTTASTDPTKYAPWTVFKGNDGVGIKTTVITYAISISGTIAPTTGWTSSVPSLVKGLYLWTKTVWTYTDNSSETGYSVTYISKDGNNGNDGIAGKDGNGIKTTTITYVGSTSGTTVPTSGWASTIPTVAAGSYLWTKTVWTYTDNTSETGYSVAKMGNTGPTGPAGAPGTNGAPGKIVSDTEPTTRFNGLTWKYSGTSDLTASDGTVIKPNIEYYFNGSKWVISLVEANQINVDTLAAISAYLGHVYAAIVEDNQSDGSGFLLNSEKQLLRVNKTANTYNQIFSEGLTTFAKISDLPGIGNIIPGANYISAILAGNFIQFGQYSTAVNSNGVPVGGTPVGLGTISFGQTTSGSYGFTLTGDLTVAGNIKSLKDTDWIDIPPASGWGGTMRYMIAEGKFYLRLTNVTNPAVSATTARTMCTIPTTAVPLGGIRGIPIMSYGQPIAELVINANGTIQFYSHDAVGTGQSLHVFVQGIPLT